MFPTLPNYKIDWRTASWRRNGILGRLVYAQRSCDIAIKSELIGSEDKMKIISLNDGLKVILDNWDRHYIKNLRRTIESDYPTSTSTRKEL